MGKETWRWQCGGRTKLWGAIAVDASGIFILQDLSYIMETLIRTGHLQSASLIIGTFCNKVDSAGNLFGRSHQISQAIILLITVK
jgi:hypothetical protein